MRIIKAMVSIIDEYRSLREAKKKNAVKTSLKFEVHSRTLNILRKYWRPVKTIGRKENLRNYRNISIPFERGVGEKTCVIYIRIKFNAHSDDCINLRNGQRQCEFESGKICGTRSKILTFRANYGYDVWAQQSRRRLLDLSNLFCQFRVIRGFAIMSRFCRY